MLTRDENGYLNPIEEINGLWYFYDETWSYSYGPYQSKVDANLALLEYCENFLKSSEEYIEP